MHILVISARCFPPISYSCNQTLNRAMFVCFSMTNHVSLFVWTLIHLAAGVLSRTLGGGIWKFGFSQQHGVFVISGNRCSDSKSRTKVLLSVYLQFFHTIHLLCSFTSLKMTHSTHIHTQRSSWNSSIWYLPYCQSPFCTHCHCICQPTVVISTARSIVECNKCLEWLC